jgi:hypothetical protein
VSVDVKNLRKSFNIAFLVILLDHWSEHLTMNVLRKDGRNCRITKVTCDGCQSANLYS